MILKYIISALLYVVAFFVFLLIGITTIILTYLFKPRQYDNLVKFFCRLFLNSLFIRVKCIGHEKIDKRRTYLFMCNHVNIFDVFLLNGYIPTFARGVELESHFSWPIWGKIATRFGTIPISHTKMISALKSLSLAEQAIQNGTSIIILPEGHRTRDGKMLPFMRGPFMLALNTKADIIPMAMIGAFKIKKTKHWLIQPGKVKLVFGEVISFQEIKDKNSKELRDFVRNKIQQLIDQHSN